MVTLKESFIRSMIKLLFENQKIIAKKRSILLCGNPNDHRSIQRFFIKNKIIENQNHAGIYHNKPRKITYWSAIDYRANAGHHGHCFSGLYSRIYHIRDKHSEYIAIFEAFSFEIIIERFFARNMTSWYYPYRSRVEWKPIFKFNKQKRTADNFSDDFREFYPFRPFAQFYAVSSTKQARWAQFLIKKSRSI